jgi:outer membrane protein
MSIKKIYLVFILAIGLTANIFAQDLKIGFANIEMVLVYMPETKAMNQELQTFQKKLGEKLQVKQQYAQTKFTEYQEMKQKATSADEANLKSKEEELIKLDEELKKEAGDADEKLMMKRQELMAPILEKLDASIKALAAAESYDLILNSVDGNGVSIVLHGPEEHDLTEKLMNSLGIEIPADN